MEQDNQYLQEERENEDILRVIFKYLQYWPWFVGTTILALILAGVYLKYSTQIYHTETQVKILDAGEGGLDLSGLQGGGPLWDISEVNLENEIEILTSRRLMGQVIKDLNLNTEYYSVGQIKSSELWKNNVPFKVDWKLPDSLIDSSTPLIYLDYISSTDFMLSTEDLEPTKHTYGESVSIDDHSFEIVLNPYYNQDFKDFSGKKFAFRYIGTQALLRGLSSAISVKPVGEMSDILDISINGENPTKNEAILDELVRQFNQDGIEDRRLVSKRTGEFIDERLKSLVKELDTVETNMVNYKQASDLVTLESSAAQLFQKEGTADLESFEVANQLSMAKSFKEALLQGEKFSLLPANVGMESGSVTDLTNKYNEAILARQKLLVSATQESPLMVQLEEKLGQLKQNIIGSINSYINTLEVSLENIRQREAMYSSNLNTMPRKEKRMRSIQRQQAVKEKLFLFLLQKKEEAALSYAITSPSVKVVDYAYTEKTPVSPKSKIILLTALILGLLVPFGVLYVWFLLSTKIVNKEQVQRILKDIPIVGEIPRIVKSAEHIIQHNDRSILAEAFRILRTNISYFKPKGDQEGAEVIFVTSAAKGEGKTFTATNLAITLGSANQRVLLMGCDLRNPQLHSFINKEKSSIGISSYLFDESVRISDITIKDPLRYGNFDVILSGEIPPNPSELLIDPRFAELMEEAKTKYDYIVVDTAPTILVTDTLLISAMADVTVFVVRAGVTDQKLLDHVKELSKNKKMKNIAVVINSLSKNGGYGYNYGYGYGYEEDQEAKKNRWKFWKRT